MRNLVLSLFAFLLMTGMTRAQGIPGMGGGQADKIYDGKITGIISDSLSGKPVEFANIVLSKKGSDKPIDGTVSDDEGAFRLKNIKNGKYRLTVSFLGYKNFVIDSLEISDKKSSVDLGVVRFAPDRKMLQEVNVEAEQSLVESQIDRIVYNAEKDLTVKGGTAADVLRRV